MNTPGWTNEPVFQSVQQRTERLFLIDHEEATAEGSRRRKINVLGLLVVMFMISAIAGVVLHYGLNSTDATQKSDTEKASMRATTYPGLDLHKKKKPCSGKNECLAYFDYDGVEGSTCVRCPKCESVVFVPGTGITCLLDNKGNHCNNIRYDDGVPKCFDDCPHTIVYNEKGQPSCLTESKKELPFVENPMLPPPVLVPTNSSTTAATDFPTDTFTDSPTSAATGTLTDLPSLAATEAPLAAETVAATAAPIMAPGTP